MADFFTSTSIILLRSVSALSDTIFSNFSHFSETVSRIEYVEDVVVPIRDTCDTKSAKSVFTDSPLGVKDIDGRRTRDPKCESSPVA